MERQMTLKELVQIALGSPTLTKAHLALLRYIINILLKKLDCSDDKVCIRGIYVPMLREKLHQSQASHKTVSIDHISTLTTRFKTLTQLKLKFEAVSANLEQHFAELLKNSELKYNPFKINYWQHYASIDEEIPRYSDGIIRKDFSLIVNSNFVLKIMRCISNPIIQRLTLINERIDNMNKNFTQRSSRFDNSDDFIPLSMKCVQHTEDLRMKIDRNHEIFLFTMREVNDLLKSKLSKLHVPAIRRYVRDRFKEMNMKMEALLQKAPSCEQGTGKYDGTCLSCNQPLIAKVLVEAKSKTFACACHTLNLENEKELDLLQRITKIQPSMIRFQRDSVEQQMALRRSYTARRSSRPTLVSGQF